MGHDLAPRAAQLRAGAARPGAAASVDLEHPSAEEPQAVVGEVSPIDKTVVAVAAFIASEGIFFVMLVLAYITFNLSTKAASAALDVKTTGIYTVCLLASSLTLHLSERHLAKGRAGAFRGWLVATIVLGGVFLFGQAREYGRLFEAGLRINSSLFGTSFFTLTGFHGLHVTVGLIALGVLAGLAFAGDSRRRFTRAFHAVGMYWHFVDAVWIVVFSVVYLRSAL